MNDVHRALSDLLFAWSPHHNSEHHEHHNATSLAGNPFAIIHDGFNSEDVKKLLLQLGNKNDEVWELFRFIEGRNCRSNPFVIRDAIHCVAQNLHSEVGALTPEKCQEIIFGTREESVTQGALHVLLLTAYVADVGYYEAVRQLRHTHAHHKAAPTDPSIMESLHVSSLLC